MTPNCVGCSPEGSDKSHSASTIPKLSVYSGTQKQTAYYRPSLRTCTRDKHVLGIPMWEIRGERGSRKASQKRFHLSLLLKQLTGWSAAGKGCCCQKSSTCKSTQAWKNVTLGEVQVSASGWSLEATRGIDVSQETGCGQFIPNLGWHATEFGFVLESVKEL